MVFNSQNSFFAVANFCLRRTEHFSQTHPRLIKAGTHVLAECNRAATFQPPNVFSPVYVIYKKPSSSLCSL